MKLLLVNDTGKRENFGCRLTSTTLADSLLDAIAEPGTALELHSAPWGFARLLKLDDAAVWRDMTSGELLLTAPVLRRLAEVEYGAAAVRAAEDADGLVFQPEGTISDDHGCLRILRNLSLPLYAMLHTDVRVAVTNGTFPLFEDERAWLIRLLLDGAAHTALRDRVSAAFWRTGFAPDTAVRWPGLKMQVRADADHLLITTGAEVSAERDAAIGQHALDFCRDTGLKPLVLTKGWERFDSLRPQVTDLGGTFVETATLNEADTWLSRCRLHLGGRYHMALMCATKGIPSALVRTNTHKNQWLAEEFAGILLASDETGLAACGRSLAAQDIPYPGLLEDVRRCGSLLNAEMARLRTALLSPPQQRLPVPVPPDDLMRSLTREVRRERWKGRIRRWMRKT